MGRKQLNRQIMSSVLNILIFKKFLQLNGCKTSTTSKWSLLKRRETDKEQPRVRTHNSSAPAHQPSLQLEQQRYAAVAAPCPPPHPQQQQLPTQLLPPFSQQKHHSNIKIFIIVIVSIQICSFSYFPKCSTGC